MTDQATLERVLPATGEDESAKRRQIIDGARAVFLSRGFDAASMNDIARAAGVSKGTLYVYFNDKERLFEAIVEQECQAQAEGIFDIDPRRSRRRGRAQAAGRRLCQVSLPAREGVTDPHRDRHRRPHARPRAQMFYEAGPARGIAKLAAYLAAQVEAGVLVVEDCEIAAAQFMESCHATLFKPILFNFAPAPSSDRIERAVCIAVKTFMAAHRAPARS